MDSITQAALGASIGEAMLGRKIGFRGAVVGAIAGTLPDLDVALMPFFDGLQSISLHRGYSHSLLFVLVFSFVLGFLLRKLNWTKNFSYRWLTLFSFLALFTHVILDAFTSYGTQLFLPLTDYRVSFDAISIVDPVYTVPLLVGLAAAVYLPRSAPSRRYWNYGGLAVSTFYLLFTLLHKQWMQNEFRAQLQAQGITYDKMLTVPVSAANWKWYGVVRNDEHLYLGWYTPLLQRPVYWEKFSVNSHLLDGLDPELVDRMKWFSQGFYTAAEHEGKIRLYNMQCDMQGVRKFGDYRAPTAFYFEITPHPDGTYELDTGMHPEGEIIDE